MSGAVSPAMRATATSAPVTIPGAATLENITASIGLAVMPMHVAKGDALVAAADAALYQAKGQGRNRVIVSDRQVASLEKSAVQVA